MKLGLLNHKHSSTEPCFHLSECVGMHVEVTDVANKLIAIGQIIDIQKDIVTLHIKDSLATELMEESTVIMLRGFSRVDKKAVHLEGSATQKDEKTWIVHSVKLHKILNDRAFYRLDTATDATVTVFSGAHAGEYSCSLTNISIGGAAIETTQEFHIADTFLLRARVNPDYGEFIMFCSVKRKSSGTDGIFRYGCQFVELSEEDQTRLAREIFNVQAMRRKHKYK